MPVEVKVPAAGESITEVMIADWLKSPGEPVREDEPLVTIETDKATMDLPAPVSGVLARIVKSRGETAKVGEVIAYLDEAPAAEPAAPSVPEAPVAPAPAEPAAPASAGEAMEAREEDVVPMSMLRRRVAERLVQAQQTAALLTTFNEIDMSAVTDLRRAHQDVFQERHQVKLGFMSFFVKAVIEALKLIPGLNAEVRGTDIVYRNYHDLGIAVGGGRGLVVPVLRGAERMSFADIERAIADFAARARASTLRPEELRDGTFTISNGGVYGSLLSTPIVNPPQSGVLGLHVIQDRPVARAGQVVIRPMMYVALTYDHRVVDGREAVTFLRHVKGCIEAPARLLLEV